MRKLSVPALTAPVVPLSGFNSRYTGPLRDADKDRCRSVDTTDIGGKPRWHLALVSLANGGYNSTVQPLNEEQSICLYNFAMKRSDLQ